MLDIGRFLDLAADVGLYAIVRPGPFICAEWEFGGMPADLLTDDDLRLRCRDARSSNGRRATCKRCSPMSYPVRSRAAAM